MVKALEQKLFKHLELIYPDEDNEVLAQRIIDTFWPDKRHIRHKPKTPDHELWSESDILVITYGNTVTDFDDKSTHPLETLDTILQNNFRKFISWVHILPFFPYSSDDGFAVIDYRQVNPDLGGWDDIEHLGQHFKIMGDVVINHGSAQSPWFDSFRRGEEPYKDYYYTSLPDPSLSQVVRPRPSPLLTEVETADGRQHVWCTFGPDQVDFNFANPEVLLEFIDIMRLYIEKNVQVFRLDAIAFLWKEIGTNCINLPQTHEIIKMFRTLADFHHDDLVLITETNVPNDENLSYFGNQNEAHMIYNFSLPPLVLHALMTGYAGHLRRWMIAQPPSRAGTAYLNFTASHDGIGLRPIEGLLPDEDLQQMINAVHKFGGEVSMRTGADGVESPYEMNITIFDAFKGTISGRPDKWHVQRFLASQIIMMALEGIPAFYLNSFFGTPNDRERYDKTGHKRAINRHIWDYKKLSRRLADSASITSYVYGELKYLIKKRRQQPAFHPNAPQFTLTLDEGFFGFSREAIDKSQTIFCITNITDASRTLRLHDLNLSHELKWRDLITNTALVDTHDEIILQPYQTMWIASYPKKS